MKWYLLTLFFLPLLANFPISPAWINPQVQVGIFYYVWYNPADPTSWEFPKICDKPVLGHYNSCDSEVIAQHFAWLSDLQIDFVILSFWGHYNQTSWNQFILNATHQVFKIAEENSVNIGVSIMVEPFINETKYPDLGYNYSEIYDYIYENFYLQYPTVFYKYQGKPLLALFNDPQLTPQGTYPKDDRFSIRIIGNDYYADWIYTDLIPVNGPVPRNRQIPVAPRFDDSHFRNPNYTVDVDLSEGVYDKEWRRAISLAEQNMVDVITICSWNEFPERTAIEPHNDTTAYDPNPYFLYEKTKKYISILKDFSNHPFLGFVGELFENVRELSDMQCRYNARDSEGKELDTLKIIENPEGGYLGVYHSNVSGAFHVRLANSTNLLDWTYIRTIDQNASQPTIACVPNSAYVVVFEKYDAQNHSSLRFQYYSGVSKLIEGAPDAIYDANRTLGDYYEGTPNIYNATSDGSTIDVCVGFHYYNVSVDVDNVAVGWLTIPLDNPQNMIWSNTKPLTEYCSQLRELYQVKGNIGDRDCEQIFGKTLTLQEANLEPRSPETNFTAWRIFLYDYYARDFRKLDIATHFNATSFGNPTFTFLKSPNNQTCIVVTYFLFGEELPDEHKDKAGELIFFKAFKTESFPLSYGGAPYSVNATSNSTILHFDFNETEKSICINVIGQNSSKGFLILVFSKELIQDLWGDNYTILLDGETWPFEDWTETKTTCIYINYVHSEHEIKIIPEFLHPTIILFLVVTLSAVILSKKKYRKLHFSDIAN